MASSTSSWVKPRAMNIPFSTSRSNTRLINSVRFNDNKKNSRIATISSLQTPSLPKLNKKSITSTPQPSPLQTAPTPTYDDDKATANNHWNFFQRAAMAALDAAEAALVSHERRHKLPKTADPRVQIAGNFSPVPEQPARGGLRVLEGKIPECIDGVYVRNGANPHYEPIAGHHFFDGDGMVHAVKLNAGAATYACRFTQTNRFIQEKSLGRPIFPKAIGELHGHSGIARLMLFYARGLFGIVDHSAGTGVANAGLVYFNDRLLAMSEDDLPYQLSLTPSGDIETVGRYDFDSQLGSTMIAHPKLDPESGDLFALSYDVVKKPYLKYFRFSGESGEKSPDVEIPLDQPTMMHDFAITENFVVVPDQQVVFKLQEMITGGSPVVYDKDKASRFGILRKDARDSSEMVWIESPECFCFHLWNAWESPETDEVVVIGSCMTPPDSIFNECDENLKSVLSEIRLNLKTGKSTRRPILKSQDQVNLEAGMVNRNKLGRKAQFAYLALAEPWPKVSGFAKVDLFSGDVTKFFYGDQRFGGEPMFVPRHPSAAEDDGYILAFVHDEKDWKSELYVVNALTMELEARVGLPSRVPYGFHGTFISSKDLQTQA